LHRRTQPAEKNQKPWGAGTIQGKGSGKDQEPSGQDQRENEKGGVFQNTEMKIKEQILYMKGKEEVGKESNPYYPSPGNKKKKKRVFPGKYLSL